MQINTGNFKQKYNTDLNGSNTEYQEFSRNFASMYNGAAWQMQYSSELILQV